MSPKSDNSNGSGHAPNIDMFHVEAQFNVGMQPSTPQGNHTPSQTGGRVYLSCWHMYIDVGLSIMTLYYIWLLPQNSNLIFLICKECCHLMLSPLYSISTAADMDGAGGGSHKKDSPPPSRSSQLLELNQLSQFKDASIASESERSFGPENDSKNVPSHIEAQSGGVMQVPTPQGNRTPDQSSIPPNPLWEAAKTPPVELAERSAVPTAARVSLSQQSHHPKTSPEKASNKHSHADATSEPVTSVERSSESLSPETPTLIQPSIKKDISPGSLILPSSQGPMHPSAHQECPRLSLPAGVGNTFEDDVPLLPQRECSCLEKNKGLTGSEPEERDSVTVRPPSQPPPTNSAQSVHVLNTSQTGSPTTGHKTHLSPSTIHTKEPGSLSNPTNHPAQQSAPNEDSLDSETSDDDDAPSDVTYQSFTSASTTHTRANHYELPVPAPTHLPSAHHSQPPTTHLKHSVNVSSHMEPAKVWLPPSEVPSMIDKSAETYPSAATEVAHEADVSAVPASSSVEQPVAVSSGEGSPAVSLTLQEMHQQDSGYSGSNQFRYQAQREGM